MTSFLLRDSKILPYKELLVSLWALKSHRNDKNKVIHRMLIRTIRRVAITRNVAIMIVRIVTVKVALILLLTGTNTIVTIVMILAIIIHTLGCVELLG